MNLRRDEFILSGASLRTTGLYAITPNPRNASLRQRGRLEMSVF